MSQEDNPETDFTSELWVSTVRQKVTERPQKRRRVTKAKKDGFIHSLNNEKRCSGSILLDLVPRGIEKVASQVGFPLCCRMLSWGLVCILTRSGS
jgi:hypothetical protein